MPDKIFISYRRDDAKAESRSIYQRLEQSFGAERLFMDVDTIETGKDFPKALEAALAQTKAMLAVIGPRWLAPQGSEGKPRLYEPGDFVSLEVATALRHGVHVVPVLVDGARMPRADELPPPLRELVNKQAAIVTHENFTSDIARLEHDLDKLVPTRRSQRRSMAVWVAGIVALAALAIVGIWWYGEQQRWAKATAACPTLRGAKTPDGATAPVTITFTNRTSTPISVIWLDTVGKQVLYNKVPVGQSHTQGTYLGHYWMVTDPSNTCLGLFAVDAAREYVVR